MLPLRFAEVLSLEAFDPPIFAAVCSPNLNVAAHRIADYKRLIGPMRLSVVQSKRQTRLEYLWPEGLTPPPMLAAAELVFWVALARMATRRRIIPCTSQRTNHPKKQRHIGSTSVLLSSGVQSRR